MLLSRANVKTVFGVAFTLTVVGTAAAAPPRGFRWSDQTGVSNRGYGGGSQAVMGTPLYQQSGNVAYGSGYYAAPATIAPAPGVTSYAPATGFGVVPPAAYATAPAAAPGTVAIRGPDGVVRNFAVEGGQAGLAQRVVVGSSSPTAAVTGAPAPVNGQGVVYGAQPGVVYGTQPGIVYGAQPGVVYGGQPCYQGAPMMAPAAPAHAPAAMPAPVPSKAQPATPADKPKATPDASGDKVQ